ncbi:MAG: alkaline phosphatase D family protein, partial [Micromonosporaceae bacterium]
RTRTTPRVDQRTGHLAFAVASCQSYPAGHYAAYRHMAEQDLDLVVFLGDYLYEGPQQGQIGRGHLPNYEIRSLEDYRIRYGQYKSDPDLRAAHAAFPWLVTIDDHEVENNFADEDSDPDSDPAEFLRRRAAAFQAYYEHQPLRLASMPDGPDMALYRRFRYGDLAEFSVLDTRQDRSDQACGGGVTERCEEAYDPTRTMTGPAQERWLLDGLGESRARWNTIAQQTLMAELDFQAGEPALYNMDNWAGYVPARERILTFLRERQPSNPVVLTGDIHASFVNDLKADFANPSSVTLGTEIACTSISSGKGNNGQIEAALPENPHVKFYNGRQRGYVRCDVTRDQWRANLLFVDDVSNPDSPVRSQARYVIEDGRPGAQPF